MTSKPVVTRFAPSPTGYLHIGGGRTALFCYLFARHHASGKFLLRIEDTDAERHNEDAVAAIVKGMEWLGCKHDGEIVRQSTRKARHQEVAKELIAKNSAYYCYCSKEHLDELRKEAELKKEPFRYPGTCRPENLGPNFVPPAGVNPVVRIRTSDEGSTGWDDLVQGTITFPNKDIDDLIILRGDGSPTYLLAVVVDDHDMEISHVIRGADHISNTPRQIVIYQAAGWETPHFGHIPLIHGPDGQKLSKRHGATGVEQYEALGYLPEAMRNYLARLSWSHGNDEIFTTEQAIEWFDVKDCNKSPSCFDFDKLKDLNAHYIRQCDPDRLLALVLKLFPDIEPFKAKIAMAVDMLKPRAKTLVEYR
jgi:glutamyl-tRNA synthetase